MARPWIKAFWILLSLWGIWLPPTNGGVLPLESQPWVRVESESLVLFSNAEPSKAKRIARDLEGLRRAMATLTRLELSSPVPTWIFVFDNDRSMIPYKHLYKGEPASMSGAFYTQPYGDYILMNGARRQEATLTVYHEYVHGVLRNNLPGLPLWLEEGLAEFFSTFEVVDGKGRIGRPLERHLNELGQGEPLGLEALLRVDNRSPSYNVFEHQGELYARSWELVHYLLLGNDERRRQMLDFLRLGFRGIGQDEAFSRAFAVDYAVIEKEVAAYRKQGFKPMEIDVEPVKAVKAQAQVLATQTSAAQKPPAHVSSTHAPQPGAPGSRAETTPPPKSDAQVPQPASAPAPQRVSSVPYTQILVNLGDLLVGQGDRHQAALFHFEEALRRDPGHAGAVAGLALVAEQKRDYPRARALFRRAVKLAPKDGRLHYHYGSSLLVLGRGASEEKLKEARFHLQRCLELLPNFAPAWARLAAAYGMSKDVDGKALETGRTAHRLLPNRPSIALQLLLLYSRTQAREEARQLYDDYFAHHPDPSSRQAADEILQRMDWLSADGKGKAIDIVR